jgi:hypothetical protein
MNGIRILTTNMDSKEKEKKPLLMYEYSMCRTISGRGCCACCSGQRISCPGKWSSPSKITTMNYSLWVHQHKFTVAILEGVSGMQVATLVAILLLLALGNVVTSGSDCWSEMYHCFISLSLDGSLIWNNLICLVMGSITTLLEFSHWFTKPWHWSWPSSSPGMRHASALGCEYSLAMAVSLPSYCWWL